MECPICISEFDNESKKPLLCTCGNSICEDCVNLMVLKGANTFTCPLCKFTVKSYKDHSLQKNSHLQTLVDRLDILRFPVREKQCLTERLIYREAGSQYEETSKKSSYSEFLSVFGISLFAVVFLPWVRKMQTILYLLGSGLSEETCKTENRCGPFRSLFGSNIILFFLFSVIWTVNSDNLIDSNVRLKKFFLLTFSFLSGAALFFYELDWTIRNYLKFQGFCWGLTLTFLESALNALLLSVLLTECIDRYILEGFSDFRRYYFSENYCKLLVLPLTFFAICFFYLVWFMKDYLVISFVGEGFLELGYFERVWIGLFVFAQVFLIWNTFVPLFTEVKFIYTTCCQLFLISFVNLVVFGSLVGVFYLNSATSRFSVELFYPGVAVGGFSVVIILAGTILIKIY